MAFIIQSQHLELDEFEIECEIRHITGPLISRSTTLDSYFTNEADHSDLVPTDVHRKASQLPYGEVNQCALKIQELQTKLLVAFNHPDKFGEEERTAIKSRLSHVLGRLNRIRPVDFLRVTAEQMATSCVSLLDIINKNEVDTVSVDDSIAAVKTVIVELPENIPIASDTSAVLNNPTTVVENIQPSSLQVISMSSPVTSKVVSETITHRIREEPQPLHDTIRTHPPSFNPDLQAIYSFSNIHRPSYSFDVGQPPSSTYNFPPYPPPQSHHYSYPPGSLPVISPSVKPAQNIHHSFVQPTASQAASQFPHYSPPNIPPSVANDFRTYSHPPPQSFNYPIRSHTKVDITKWNLSFDGSPKGMPVEKFFFRLEHLANTHEVSMYQLVNDLGFLLHGTAREHYWMLLQQNPNSNWAHLRESFIHRFQDRQSDIDIHHAIDNRKQRPKESFIDFYYDVLNLALPLKSSLPEVSLVNILQWNMRPGLKIALAGETFATISSLVSRCVAMEDAWKSVGHVPEFSMSYNRNIHEMYASNSCEYPTFSHNPDPAVDSNFSQGVEAIRLAHIDPKSKPHVSQSPNNNSLLVCWNCSSPGHLYSDCDLVPQRIFCYGCGTPEVLKPHCLKCQKPGNFRQGMRAPGFSLFRYPPPPRPTTTEAASNTDRELRLQRH